MLQQQQLPPQQQQQLSTTFVTVPSQPLKYMVAARPKSRLVYASFPKKQAYGAGILLLVSGILSIVFNIVELVVGNSYSSSYDYYVWWLFGNVGHGFWVGVMCLIPGAFGIGAGKHKTKCLINAFNVMSIIAASLAAGQFGVALPGAIVGPLCTVGDYYYYTGYNGYTSYEWGYTDYCTGFQGTAVAMEALLTALAVVEAAVAIWGSAICCRTICCCSCCLSGARPQVATVPQPVGMQMMVINTNQQAQPVMVQGYANAGYQPGYPGQPVQFTALPPMYPPQGQFIPAGQPLNYPVASPPIYVNQPTNQPSVDVQVKPGST